MFVAAAAACLKVTSSVGEFNVLTAIQTEVNTMNKHLEELSAAVDDIPEPTQEPSPSSPTEEPSPTDKPSPTDESPSPSGSSVSKNYNKLRRLSIWKNFLTLEVGTKHLQVDTKQTDPTCDALQDIHATVEEAQVALDLVAEMQLSNVTLGLLQDSNVKLDDTTSCVIKGQITLSSDDKEAVQTAIAAAEASGEAASDVIDNIINPPPPEEEPGFRAATIALGVLLALALTVVVGLAIVVMRRPPTTV